MSNTDWYARHRLFHYTKSEVVVASILERGFLLVPNKRHLIDKLLPGHDFSQREPQEFGMVSFTELPVERARSHRESFGEFGICVSWDWANRNDAQRVIYAAESGLLFERFKWLFELGQQELRVTTTEKPQVLLNKAMAAAHRGQLYHAVLTLYEYMEPSRNSSQVEWRIVNSIPVYHDLTDRASLIAKMIEMSKFSTIGLVPLTPNDVEFLVCPRNRLRSLRQALPKMFENVPVFSYVAGSTLRAWMGTAFQWAAEFRRRRDRIVYVPYKAPSGSVLLPMATDGHAIRLPPVHHMSGLALYPDAVGERRLVALQYQDSSETWFELSMAERDALYLSSLLSEMESDPHRRR